MQMEKESKPSQASRAKLRRKIESGERKSNAAQILGAFHSRKNVYW